MPSESDTHNFPRAGDLARGIFSSDTQLNYQPYWWDAAPPRR